ncbi:MAG: GNAT family N-acetyltransferase [Oscillospiraceae bacterium]|nr:GNAT family N-acetyltransferase [Oscillospiraceae bacterium]
MNCSLQKVSLPDKEILYRLLQYSLFEESQTDLNEMNNEALFEYEWFDSYFTDKDREAYFIKSEENKLCGFVMINTYMQKMQHGHSIAEFMIIPQYRRKKLGKSVAFQIFDIYKGNWEVSPSYGSYSAYMFWKNIIEEYTDSEYIYEDGIFIFKSGEQNAGL